MAAKDNYFLLLNLGLLGFNAFLSFFEIAIGKQIYYESLDKANNYSFSDRYLFENSKHSSLEKSTVKNKENLLLTLKIFADKQYDYDQNIYLAKGNVKAIVNGGILRSELLRYERSTGILSAEGNVRFTKGGQYFRGKKFIFNLLNKEGLIQEAYGILDIKNLLDDLKLQSISRNINVKNRSLNDLSNERKNIYSDGIEFSFGNIKFPQNKITRSNKSIGSINNWRFKSDLINIHDGGWKSSRIYFTNDPFDPHQISFEGIDVIAEEEEGELLITSSRTNLILERRTKIFLGKRIFGVKKKKKNKFDLMFDFKDRDGLTIVRRSNTTIINNNIKLDFHPHFLINRAILGETNSYKNDNIKDDKVINFSDLFGFNMKLNADFKDWSFDTTNDLSTLNSSRIFSGLRHSSSFKRDLKIPFLNDSSFNIFTTFRSRAWNGTIGETEIKSGFGGFIEKAQYFKVGQIKNNFNLRLGTAQYEAERLKNAEMISLWRSSVFASLDSEYDIWRINQKKIDKKKLSFLSPILINPELVLRTNINSAYFKYEDGSDQGFVKLSVGPEIRLGKLEKNLLDYTKLSIMPGVKIKSGNSPFKFDNAIDLKTLNISFMQQIYGPLIFDITSNINIDNSSENYGDYYDTKLGLLWHKRAYEFGVYLHPNHDAGGLYFRINGFNFDKSVKAIF